MTTENEAPQRVVAVVNSKAVKGYPYKVAQVYELKPRKDGTLTYRWSETRYAWPHRSEKLAIQDAKEIAEEQDIPFWPWVRHHMSATEAVIHAETVRETT
jgi:hypothetical protein